MAPTRIRFLITPLLSAYYCGPKFGFDSGGRGVVVGGGGLMYPADYLFVFFFFLSFLLSFFSFFLFFSTSDLLCLRPSITP